MTVETMKKRYTEIGPIQPVLNEVVVTWVVMVEVLVKDEIVWWGGMIGRWWGGMMG